MRYFKEKTSQLVYAYTQEDLDNAENAGEDSCKIFHDIKSRLKNMTELKGSALRNHLNPPQTDADVRAQRDGLLVQVDSYASNPLRWADTSQEDKDTIADYRQLLLNVPQQAGFPLEIEWPELPSVLQ